MKITNIIMNSTSLAHIFLVVKNEDNIPELCLLWGKISINKRGK